MTTTPESDYKTENYQNYQNGPTNYETFYDTIFHSEVSSWQKYCNLPRLFSSIGLKLIGASIFNKYYISDFVSLMHCY